MKALQLNDITSDDQTEFMDLFQSYEYAVCQGDASLNTIAQVQQNGLFRKLMQDLIVKIKTVVDEEPDLASFGGSQAGFGKYMCPVSTEFKDIEDRVACIFCNKSQEDLGISDEQMESVMSENNETIPVELRRISNLVGELLEDLELEFDSVDQMVALFLAIAPENVALCKDREHQSSLGAV